MRRRRIIAPLLAAAALGGCSVVPTPPQALPDRWAPSPSASPLPSWEADSPYGFTPGEQAAYRIRNDGCEEFASGSGFAIDEHTIITNRHVVADQWNLEVTGSDGSDYTVMSSAVAANGDLAILTIEETLPAWVPLGDADPSIGEHITVVGYPEGKQLKTTEGRVLRRSDDRLGDAAFVFDATAEVKPGSSGSAVYDDEWNVVGVIYAGNDVTGEGSLMPLSLLQDLLADEDLRQDNPQACEV